MECKYCNALISDDSVFCTNCGKKIDSVDNIAAAQPENYENPIDNFSSATDNTSFSSSQEFTFDSADIKDDTSAQLYQPAPEIPETQPAPVSEIFKEIKTETENTASASTVAADSTDEKTDEEDNRSSVGFPDSGYAQEVILPVEDAPKKLSAGRAAGASVISFFAVLFLVIASLLLSARIGLSSSIIRKSAESLRAETLLDSKIDEDETIAEYIFENMHGAFITNNNAQVKDIRSFIIKSNITDFIAEKLEAYSEFLISGNKNNDPSVTAEELSDFFKENDRLITEEFGYIMKAKDYDDLEKAFTDEGLIEAVSIKEWSDEIGFNLNNLSFVFSFITIGIMFALSLVFYIWAAIVLDKHTRTIIGFIGNITFIGGLLIFIPTIIFVLGSSAAAMWSDSAAVYAASKLLFPFAVAGACTGLFEIIIGFVFKKIRKHIRKKELKSVEV